MTLISVTVCLHVLAKSELNKQLCEIAPDLCVLLETTYYMSNILL